MVEKVKVRKIGNSLGVILPKETLGSLRVAEGDELTITESEAGVQLSASDPEFDKSMKVFDSVIHRYRNALKELAK